MPAIRVLLAALLLAALPLEAVRAAGRTVCTITVN
jgi:hypothetical protein